jgi:hypothetical protein
MTILLFQWVLAVLFCVLTIQLEVAPYRIVLEATVCGDDEATAGR